MGAKTVLLGLLAVLLFTSESFAFPADVQIIGKVPLGQQPRLVFTAADTAQKVLIRFTRDDGRKFSFALGNISSGYVKEIALDGHAGKHRYEGTMQAEVNGEQMESPLSFTTVVAAPLSISVDRDSVDLTRRSFHFKTPRAISAWSLTLIGVDGSELAKESAAVKNWSSGEAIAVSWPPVDSVNLLRLELRVEDEEGFFTAVALTPWSVEIPHEEVLFESASAEISPDETPKLEASLQEITNVLERFSQINGVQLFIAGHTDTVGSTTYNQNLSRQRAQAIATWFVKKRLPVRVSFEGFGETHPRIKTGDEVDEPKNRRVDYILSVETPHLKSGVHSWKRLNH